VPGGADADDAGAEDDDFHASQCAQAAGLEKQN
jgi:hypothetical protein